MASRITNLNNLISILSKKKNSIITQVQCAIQLLPNPTHRVFVDNIEDTRFVLLTPRQKTIEEYGLVSYHLYIDDNKEDNADRDSKLAQFLDFYELNDASKSLQFNAINLPEFQALKRYFTNRGIQVVRTNEQPNNVYVFDHQAKIELPKLNQRFVLDSLTSNDVEEVDRCWHFRSNFSKRFLARSIENYPSVCIRDKEQGGRLASFLVATSYGLQNNMFTYSEYRNKGLAELVAVTHARQLIPLFGASVNLVASENTVSKNLVLKLNYKLQMDHQAMWLRIGELPEDF